jgi:hypothetical protein
MDETLGTSAVPVSGTAVLTDETFETVKSMLKSNDEGDHKMAQLILNQLDVETNIVRIWELAKSYAHNMVNLRTKASRKFRDSTNLFWLANTSNYTFAAWLNRKGWLTPERFQYLKKDIVRHLSYKDDHTFYRLSFEIKEEYKHLDPDQQIQYLKPDKT